MRQVPLAGPLPASTAMASKKSAPRSAQAEPPKQRAEIAHTVTEGNLHLTTDHARSQLSMNHPKGIRRYTSTAKIARRWEPEPTLHNI